MSAERRRVDHLVIGGGLAGSMAAMRLAAAGCDVMLLEKERSAHHKVCGEFLSSEAIDYLSLAGVNPLYLGAATIHSIRMCSKHGVSEADLPFTALSLSRRALDAAMIARAAENGCEVRPGSLVERLTRRDDDWLAEFQNGEQLRARTVFLATGKHDLRGWERGRGVQGDLIGFKMHWQLAPAQTEDLRGALEMFLFPGGYGGLSLVEGDAANLCLVVRRSELRRIGGWSELLANLHDDNRQLQQRLQGAKALWERPLAISPIPYGHLVRGGCGLWRVGDQAAVIPSFTGDGMSIALHSGTLAAEMYLAGAGEEEFHRKLHKQLRRGMLLATQISRAMVTGAGRTLMPLSLSLYPNAMRWIAASTRIPEEAMLAKPAS
ncbi:MAG: NAD(P)/FAD-dependent oxidoreductase [Terracidiphilus sp.]